MESTKKKETVAVSYLSFDKNVHLQINSAIPQLKNQDLPPNPPNVVNWGALRLFIMLLQFCNFYVTLPNSSDEKTILVYAGASPGVSIAMVRMFYPNIEYHLYDPNGDSPEKPLAFDSKLRNKKNVYLYNELFTDQTAEEWAKYAKEHPNHRIYFVSDIRRTDYPSKPEKEKGEKDEDFSARSRPILELRERIVLEELEAQKRWVQTMMPRSALLKFRPPKRSMMDDDRFSYLDGFAYRGAFGDNTSQETFLVPHDNITMREWSSAKYEEAMNYHNYHMRTRLFLNPINGKTTRISINLGLTNDYDSCLFITVLKDYFECYERFLTEKKLLEVSEHVLNGLGRIYGEQKGKRAPNLFSRRKKLEEKR